MTENDRERIERALRKQAEGLTLDAHDRWCIRAAERYEWQQQRDEAEKSDTYFVADATAEAEPFILDPNDPFTAAITDAIGYALAQAEHELRQEFQRELKALRDQVRVTRTLDDDRVNVIDLPKMSWRCRDAA